MAKHGRGLICLPMTGERLDELEIPLMVSENSASFGTAFCVSIEAKGTTTTGISAGDRAATIRAAIDPATKPRRSRPARAHVSRCARATAACSCAPARRKRPSIWRASPGLRPAGVICEIMNDDGTMARVPELTKFARRHGLLMITIADLIRYRMRTESLVKRVATATLPTKQGPFHDPRLRQPDRRRDARRAGPRRPRRRTRRDGARALEVPDRRRLPLPPLRLRPAARRGHGADRRRGAGRAALSATRKGGGSASPTRSAPTSCRIRGSTRSRPTSGWGSRPTSATTASGPRFFATLASRTMRLLTNNPRKFVGLEGYGLSVVGVAAARDVPGQRVHAPLPEDQEGQARAHAEEGLTGIRAGFRPCRSGSDPPAGRHCRGRQHIGLDRGAGF